SGVFETLFDVGLCFDATLGLPYYPGSTLKGASRSVAEELLGEDHARALFGKPGEKGWMGLFEYSNSYPVGCITGKHPCLVVTGDVVSPHYFKPGVGLVETELEAEPTPIIHAAIAPGTVFRVIIGVREPPKRAEEGVRKAIRKAREVGLLGSDSLNATSLSLIAARLAIIAMSWGFAARSGKGYNVFRLLDKEELDRIDRSVVSIKMSRGGH
ncbi:MAG: RAMP superfamily CRISPR-associated protein, partial [Desulfurococcales archaeon]|nr:RAMP superfamily CRISPR-associated protein [Desulfurococcales archaeon]